MKISQSFSRLIHISLLFLISFIYLHAVDHNEGEISNQTFNPQKPKELTQLIDVGGYKLKIRVIGEGKPTVVLESGLGSPSMIWTKVQKKVATFTKVVSYDRAGLGQSEPGQKPRHCRQIAHELHKLLNKANISPPFILVGHSIGGFNIRLFASLFPDEVAGIVFVDAIHEDFEEKWKAMLPPGQWEQTKKSNDELFSKAAEGMRAEYEAFQESAKLVKESGKLPDVPIVVITNMAISEFDRKRGISEKSRQLSYDLHHEWVTQVTSGFHLTTDKGGHYIQLNEPELVIKAIRKIFDLIYRQ